MTEYVITPPPQACIALAGEALTFPVRRIWCVGRNYADHAREMGADPDREPPFFFSKPADAVVSGGGLLGFPMGTGDFQFEVELAVALAGAGVNVSAKEAEALIFGYAVALDMTRRDLQAEAKRMARPWDMAKGFDHSCPISPLRRASDIGHPAQGKLSLEVDGVQRQIGDLSDMIWSTADCVAALSRLVALAPGDIILTGTPAGVGPILRGETIHAACKGVGTLEVTYR